MIIPEHAQAQVMSALMAAYKKHVMGADSIGWDELSDTLTDALCEAMGDEAFNAWLDSGGEI